MMTVFILRASRYLQKGCENSIEVVIVAPDRERSAAGHSMTLHRPLLIEEIKESVFSVNGTPTDCVNIAVKGLLKETPKLVVSGINKGPNLGDDITYSGTVAGAMEAILLGIPAFAISVVRTEGFSFCRSSGGGGRHQPHVFWNRDFLRERS